VKKFRRHADETSRRIAELEALLAQARWIVATAESNAEAAVLLGNTDAALDQSVAQGNASVLADTLEQAIKALRSGRRTGAQPPAAGPSPQPRPDAGRRS
jgi:hypothetical protein